MPIVFCLIPQDASFKPRAAAVAALVRLLLDQEFIDNDEVYLDVAYENGHHRPGVTDMITVEAAAAELEKCDDLAVTDFFVENIRGTARIPQLFENSDQKNRSLVGWLAVRVFDEPYPMFSSATEYSVRCGFCGHEAGVREWGCQGKLFRCPACGQCDELHNLDFSPAVEFARFVLEISELVFTDDIPRLKPDAELAAKLQEILGAELRPIWYEM